MSMRVETSVRVGRLELKSLAWAFALSLVLHFLFWGTYAAGKRLHWWEKIRMPAWVQKLTQPVIPAQPKQPVNREPPLMFVDVSQAAAVTEPPKNAAFYSDRNSIAANPDLDQNSNVPKLDGKQEQLPKPEDTPRKFDKLMPDPPAPPSPSESKPKLTPGDLALAKIDPNAKPDKPRPRTLKEALLRNSQIPGQKAKQDGGALQRPNASYDVKATGFGAYDRMFIDAVSTRWYDLLDNMSYDAYRSGYVKLEFNLNYKGQITDMKVLENTVTETLSLLCQKAVLDPAPFGEWPREMRLMVNEDSRRITFTFYYN